MIEHYAMERTWDDETGLYPASVLMFESLTNETEGHRFYDLVTQFPAGGQPTFRELQREWGRCKSKVYCDTPTGADEIGWYFESRQKYEDADDTYLRGAWITFMELPALDFLPNTVREAQQAIELLKGAAA